MDYLMWCVRFHSNLNIKVKYLSVTVCAYTQKRHSLDNVDLKILCELQKNSRTSYRTIGDTLKISANTVNVRIDRMLQEGVIEKFVLEVNPTQFNYKMIYLLIPGYEMSLNDNALNDIINLVGYVLFQAICIGHLNVFCIIVKDDDNFERKIHHLKSLIKSARVLGIVERPKGTRNTRLLKMIETDYKLIQTLLLDPRAKVDEVASRICPASKTVSRRLDKLIENRVIQFNILYNPTAFIGYIPFHILVHADQNALRKVLDEISKQFGQYFFGYPEINSDLNIIILDMFSTSIYELDTHYKKIRSTFGVTSADLLIPTKIRISQKWLFDELESKLVTSHRNSVHFYIS